MSLGVHDPPGDGVHRLGAALRRVAQRHVYARRQEYGAVGGERAVGNESEIFFGQRGGAVIVVRARLAARGVDQPPVRRHIDHAENIGAAAERGEENALELFGLPVPLRRALLPPGAAQKGAEALVEIDGTVNVVDAFARGFQPLRPGRHELGAQRERLRADDCLRAHLRDQHNDPHGNGEQQQHGYHQLFPERTKVFEHTASPALIIPEKAGA